jgi:hypothetical protein
VLGPGLTVRMTLPDAGHPAEEIYELPVEIG